MEATRSDVIVIGAGAAGLAAARALTAHGLTVDVLEARGRLGGRIHTLDDPAFPLPVELGAEFIHGRAPSTFQMVGQLGLTAYDVGAAHWQRRGDGRLSVAQFEEELGPVFGAARDLDEDEPFAHYLERVRHRVDGDVAAMAKAYVEGYDAADIARASTLALAEEWAAANVAEEPQFRLLQGYGEMVRRLAATLRPPSVRVHLETVVRHVTWSRGAVEVAAERRGRTMRHVGRRAVVTLPLGVLHQPPDAANGVRFQPELPEKREAAEGLGAGPVVKVIAKFRESFWESREVGRRAAGQSLADAGYFHAPGLAVPTWWTMLPMRAPVLVGWAGGGQTDSLTGRGRDAILDSAFASLAGVFHTPAWRLRGMLEVAHVSDWLQDPFSCGAYSYVAVGGRGARERLAAAVESTLFYAGEAADTGPYASTVAGALGSGARAAGEVVASL